MIAVSCMCQCAQTGLGQHHCVSTLSATGMNRWDYVQARGDRKWPEWCGGQRGVFVCWEPGAVIKGKHLSREPYQHERDPNLSFFYLYQIKCVRRQMS